MNNADEAVGTVLACRDYPGNYKQLRVSTTLAASCQPGHALLIDSASWGILQAAPRQGWIDCLQYGVAAVPGVDARLTLRLVGEPFILEAATPRALLFADSGGLAPIAFLSYVLKQRQPRCKPFAILELSAPLPFQPQPSRIMISGLPADTIAALPLLEDWHVPSRIAGPTLDHPGCFTGTVVDLARGWLDIAHGVADITLFACGSEALLSAVSSLGDDYQLPQQLRLSP